MRRKHDRNHWVFKKSISTCGRCRIAITFNKGVAYEHETGLAHNPVCPGRNYSPRYSPHTGMMEQKQVRP